MAGVRSSVLPRLYAILDVDLATSRGLAPLAVLEQWLEAGVRLVQLRGKTLESGAFLTLADQALRLTRQAGARLIINDRPDIAAMAGADGVHVGQDDLPPRAVRSIVGASPWVGLSTHTDAQLDAGTREPVTYLAMGPVFATSSKAAPDPVVGLAGVRRAASRAHEAGLPLVAIGGIGIDRATDVIAAGASSVALISDLLHEPVGDRAKLLLGALAGACAEGHMT